MINSNTVNHLALSPLINVSFVKDRAQGSGLGLAAVYGISKQSGGFIGVDSEPGNGTTFTLHFPSVDGPEHRRTISPTGSAAEAPYTVRSERKILLVEDDINLRHLLIDVLTARGYTLIATSTPEDELRIFERERPFDVLVTDIVMPGMSGHEMIQKLRGEGHRVKVIYMSGYSDYSPDVGSSDSDFLPKPFDAVMLLNKITAMLEGKPREAVRTSPPGTASLDPKVIDFRSTIEYSPIPMFRADPGGLLLYANSVMLDCFGFETEEPKKDAEADMKSSLLDSSLEFTDKATAEGVISGTEKSICKANGETVWVAIYGRVVKDEDGEPAYTEGALVDITDRRSWEESLAKTIGQLNKVVRKDPVFSSRERFRNLSVRETQIV